MNESVCEVTKRENIHARTAYYFRWDIEFYVIHAFIYDNTLI